jgi:hypothetical protein
MDRAECFDGSLTVELSVPAAAQISSCLSSFSAGAGTALVSTAFHFYLRDTPISGWQVLAVPAPGIERHSLIMDNLPFFEVVGEHAVFRPAGETSLPQAVEMVTSAIALTRERRVPKLLVVTTGLTGFQSPGVVDRFFFIQEWAKAANGIVRVALVVGPEFIDQEKFGVTVARNIGFYADVFLSEEEALHWLNNSHPPR